MTDEIEKRIIDFRGGTRTTRGKRDKQFLSRYERIINTSKMLEDGTNRVNNKISRSKESSGMIRRSITFYFQDDLSNGRVMGGWG